MKVGEKGHYLQTEVMIILKAVTHVHICPCCPLAEPEQVAGNSTYLLHCDVAILISEIASSIFSIIACLPTISYPFQIPDDTIIHMC